MRLAERNRQRELRAERLARLRPPSPPERHPVLPEAAPVAWPRASPRPAPARDTRGAAPSRDRRGRGGARGLPRALTGDLPAPPRARRSSPAALLPFQRPGSAAGREAASGRQDPGDLDRLPGVGPGLIWALERAGLRRLADLAPLAPAELAARLGPLGRLVPAERWIATAREAAG